MRDLLERILIRSLKNLNVDLLPHAHVQIGVGHNTYLSGEDFVIDTIIARALNKNPEVIFDVGANTGKYANDLAATFPNALIHCFEPIPKTFDILKDATKSINTINNCTALGSEAGSITLFLGQDNLDGSMASAYKDSLQSIFQFVGEVDTTVTVPVITLDEYCDNQNYDIDFLKIDVEGHELNILHGAKNLIAGNRIKLIQFEFNEFNIFSKSFIFDFYQVLKSYDFYRIMPQRKLFPMKEYNSALEIFRYQNILAIHKSLEFKI